MVFDSNDDIYDDDHDNDDDYDDIVQFCFR